MKRILIIGACFVGLLSVAAFLIGIKIGLSESRSGPDVADQNPPAVRTATTSEPETPAVTQTRDDDSDSDTSSDEQQDTEPGQTETTAADPATTEISAPELAGNETPETQTSETTPPVTPTSDMTPPDTTPPDTTPPDTTPPDTTPTQPALESLYGKKIKEQLTGKVLDVVDGDSLKVDANGTEVQVNFDSIDAPERNQPHGKEAEQALADLVKDKQVEILKINDDRFGRTYAFVRVDGNDIGIQLLKGGHAWHNEQYSDDPEMATAHKAARDAKTGLWSDENAQAPWEWRDQNK